MFENHFKYHPPTNATAPLYTAIREAEAHIQGAINDVQAGITRDEKGSEFDLVLASTRTSPIFYEHINSSCLNMANLCVVPSDHPGFVALQVCRSAANEAISTRRDVGRLLAIARSKAQEARWLMCAHIAVQSGVGATPALPNTPASPTFGCAAGSPQSTRADER